MSISIFIAVYNEEKRIESFIKSFLWVDKIFIMDKGSTDNTLEICNKYDTQIINLEYSEPYDISYLNNVLDEYCVTDWAMIGTGSDVIHPVLSKEIAKTIKSDFIKDFDLIKVPFQTYILGINDKSSPWYTESKAYVFRREVLKVNDEGVHDGIQFYPKKVFEIKLKTEYSVYHLTHETVSSMMSRHTSYWRGESLLPNEIHLGNSFKIVVRKFFKILFKSRIYTKGWDGIMIAFSYLTYYMMSFVYQWERKRSNAKNIYSQIREEIIKEVEKSTK